jgi:3-deoxy-D-manno-octulosonate 8-phosphate phosphatase (KDO 8-P phosphatase)
MKQNFKELLHHVKCFILDVDGVLTDGSVMVMPGELIRTMNIRDGYALHEAVKAGYRVVIISGGKSESVRTRLNNLGIADVFLGVNNKVETLMEIMEKYKLRPEQVLYMGDDLPDIEVMKLCGVPTCPQDAAFEIRELAVYVSDKSGGKGCVRDVLEQTMRLHNKWRYTTDTTASL